MESPLASLTPGLIRKGIVKKFLKSGALISLGDVNGLLNTSDMRWSPIKDPSEMLVIGQEIDVLIISTNSAQDIRLGLKQIQNLPWELAVTNYPIGSRHIGTVVNITPSYVYIQLESNFVGRSDIFQPKISNHTNNFSKNLSLDEKVEVEVISLKNAQKIIKFSIKKPSAQWVTLAKQFKANDLVVGNVCTIFSHGALIEIGKGLFGYLHVHNLSWLRIAKPDEVLKIGDVIRCLILDVDYKKYRIDIGLKQLFPNPWEEYIPNRYKLGVIIKGTIKKNTGYGLFIELELGLFGLLHNSELMVEDVEKFKNNLKKGDILEVCVIDVDITKRRIGLSLNISKNIIH